MLHIFCGMLTVGGYITILSSAITFIIALFGNSKKSEIKGTVIALVGGILAILLSSLILRLAL